MVALSPIILYVFVDLSPYGYIGGAYASIIYSFIPVILLVAYMFKIDMGYLFIPIPLAELFEWKGVKQYLDLAIPGLLQICLEWWILEAVSIMAGLLPDSQWTIGACAICLTLETLTKMAWLAYLAFNSVRVGYFIGAQDVESAKRAAIVGVGAGLATALLLSILCLTLSHQIPQIYTSDPHVVDLTSKLILVLAIVLPFDALNNCIGGIMGGLGLQRIAAKCQLFGYYIIGMPTAAVIVFARGEQHLKSTDVLIIWGGVALSMATSCLMQIFYVLRYDWNLAVIQAQERLETR